MERKEHRTQTKEGTDEHQDEERKLRREYEERRKQDNKPVDEKAMHAGT